MPRLQVGGFPRPPFVRRYLVQIVAVTVAVAGVVVLGVFAFRPSGGSGGSGVVRSPVTAVPTATPDPRVDEVKAVARKYLEAFAESAKTGDTSAVDALTEKDSKAYSSAAEAAFISKDAHHNFMAQRVEVDEGTWMVNVLATHATVAVTYRLFGHDADWPSLRPREADHETPSYRSSFQLEMVGEKWLIYDSA
jgi:hypothetical protein